MTDMGKVIKEFEAFVNGYCPSDFKHVCHIELMGTVLALLKEQENTIDTLNTVIFGYETGAIKHNDTLLKEQEAIKPNTEGPIWCSMKNIEEASININNQNPVIALKAAIVCTNTQDEYSAGFRNGVRYAISILTGDEPKYENVT